MLLSAQQVAAEIVANDTQQLVEQAEEATGEVHTHTHTHTLYCCFVALNAPVCDCQIIMSFAHTSCIPIPVTAP